MTENKSYKEKRMLITGWLSDMYGKSDDTIVVHRKAAVDLIKYLTAHGWEIRPTQTGDHTYQPIHNSRSGNVCQTTRR